MEFALVENIQRVDLNPIEEAEGYAILRGKYSFTQAKIASSVSKSRSEISNKMRLLKLPPIIKDSLRKGELSYGHARCLVAVKKSTEMIKIYYLIINQHLSVRATEQLINNSKKKKIIKTVISNDIKQLQTKLEESLDTTIIINMIKNYRGVIKISFQSIQHLKKLINNITK